MQHPERIIRRAIRLAEVSGYKAVKYGGAASQPYSPPSPFTLPPAHFLQSKVADQTPNLSMQHPERLIRHARVAHSGSNDAVYPDRGVVKGHSAAEMEVGCRRGVLSFFCDRDRKETGRQADYDKIFF